jgi:hypothetical protein
MAAEALKNRKERRERKGVAAARSNISYISTSDHFRIGETDQFTEGVGRNGRSLKRINATPFVVFNYLPTKIF